AELYPEKVGRFVLDGAMDPSLTMNQISAGQAEGFEHAVEAFLANCLEKEDCPFEGTEEEAKQQLIAFFSALDETPLDSGDPDRPVTGAMARSVVMTLLYEDGLWQYGRQALSAAMKGDGAQLLNIADLSSERQPDGSYRTNAAFAIL